MTDVSVIVAAWQAADTLEAAVASALAQDGVAVEVLVVDDASTDGTGAVAAALAARHPAVTALHLEANAGPSAARNRALAVASGRWVAVLDADDRFLPGRLRRLVGRAEAQGLDAVLDNALVVGEAGRGRPENAGRPLVDRPVPGLHELWRPGRYALDNRPYGHGPNLGFLKPLLARRFLADRGLAYDEALRSAEDYMLMLRLLIAGARVGYEPEPGYLYAARAGSLSGRVRPGAHRALMRAERRLIDVEGSRLPAADRAGLEAHLAALALARRTFHLFEALKRRRTGRAARLLAGGGRDAPRLVARVAAAALARGAGVRRRGR